MFEPLANGIRLARYNQIKECNSSSGQSLHMQHADDADWNENSSPAPYI